MFSKFGETLRRVAALYRRELSGFFQTPVAYVAAAIFAAANAAVFFAVFFLFDRAELRQFFAWLPLWLAFFMSPLAMRLVAEERRRGTIEILTTLPIGSGGIVAAKFFAAWTTGLFLLAPTVLLPLAVRAFGPLDPGPVVSGYLGAVLLTGLYAAVGLLSSTVARHEAVALILALLFSLALAAVQGLLVLLPGGVVDLVQFVGTSFHMGLFARGQIDLRSIVYLSSLTFVLLYAARMRLVIDTRRPFEVLQPVLVAVVFVLVNLVAGNTSLWIDATRNDTYRLSAVTRETLARVVDPLRLRVFFTERLPAPHNTNRQYLLDLLDQYERANSEFVRVEIVDTDSPEGKSAAAAAGITQVEVQELRAEEFQVRSAYLGVSLAYGNAAGRIDPIDGTEGLEYRITEALAGVVNQVDALAGSEEPVRLVVVASNELEELAIEGFDELQQRTRRVFDELNAENLGRLQYEYLAVQGDQQVERLADRYGLQPLAWVRPDGSRRSGVLDVVLTRGEDAQPISLRPVTTIGIDGGAFVEQYLLPDDAQILEAGRLALRRLVTDAPVVAYATGAGFLPLDDYQTGAGPLRDLLEQRFELVEIDLSATPIPAGVRTIILNGNRASWSEGALYRLDQFLLGGGSALVFADRFAPEPQTGAWFPVDNELFAFLQHYGVTVETGLVLDEASVVLRQGGGQQAIYNAPLLRGDSLFDDHPITAFLDDVIVLNAAPVEPLGEPSDDVSVVRLMESSDAAWSVENPEQIRFFQQGPPPGQENRFGLAVLAQGRFSSFFDAPPQNFPALARHRTLSAAEGRVIVLGSSLITTRQLIDPATRTPNTTLLMNAVDYLNGAPGFAELRSKGLNVPRLTVENPILAVSARWLTIIGGVVLVGAAAFLAWRLRVRRARALRIVINAKLHPKEGEA